MKKEKSLRKESILIIVGVLIAAILVLTGCEKKENSSNTNENGVENKVQNVENQAENTAAKQNKTDNNNNSTSNTTKSSSTNNTAANNTSTNNKAVTSSKLVVSREGSEETIPSKEYTSSLGYTMRYASEEFKASHHDDIDWYERDGDTNCVAVEKENVPYSKKISSISNYKKTEINGYEAVYITRRAEGQYETIYYVNAGKDSTYIITTSCQDSTEYLEGLGHIMDAMVQTFALK